MAGTGMFQASIDGYRKEFKAKKHRVETSLNALKNQDSEYAMEHKKLIGVFNEIIWVLEQVGKPSV